MSRTLAIIPARGGSKRVNKKNLRTLAGVPLVARAIQTALLAERLDSIVVSSDDQKILEIAGAFRPELALARPAELARDDTPAILAVQHALKHVESSEGKRFDIVVILQCTSPFTLPQDIDRTVELLEKSTADSAVSVARLAHDVHPAKLKVLEGDRLLPYLEEERGRMSVSELPIVYVRNCAVYASRRSVIERGLVIGEDCRGYVMPRERSVDINDELDFAFAEFLMCRQESVS